MAVTFSDSCSPHPNKLSRFVGICIDRGGCGLRAWFIVRNIIEGQGVEFMYQMYRYRDTAGKDSGLNFIISVRLSRRLRCLD